MIIIGITGSIGMGKSTIAKMLKQFKIPVFDSDKEVRDILDNNDAVKKQIYDLWPDVILTESKTGILNCFNMLATVDLPIPIEPVIPIIIINDLFYL